MLFSFIGYFLVAFANAYTVEDVHIPEHCDTILGPGDHALVEFEVAYGDGEIVQTHKSPDPYYYIHLESSELSVYQALKGMCRNSTRILRFEEGLADLRPIYATNENIRSDKSVSLTLTVVHATSASDYRIFDGFLNRNVSLILDYVEERVGINAVDSTGNTPLMLASSSGMDMVIAGLLNARLPRVNVNLSKSNGYTALFYSVQQKTNTIMLALLRRGADPNTILLDPVSYGSTPLHFACMLEQLRHIEVLIEYGADPKMRNRHGETAFDLIPKDAVLSTKQYIARMFNDAVKKQSAAKDL